MALFKSNQIVIETAESKANKAVLINQSFQYVIDIKDKEIAKIIGNVDNAVAWKSDGEFSLHELLTYLLGLSGPADLYLATWGLSAEPVNRLFELKKAGMVKSIYAMLDFRVRDRSPEAMQRLESIATEVVLLKSHAKVIAIHGEKESFCVIGSANFTNNPRIEAGVIIKGNHTTNETIKWITDAMNGAKKRSSK